MRFRDPSAAPPSRGPAPGGGRRGWAVDVCLAAAAVALDRLISGGTYSGGTVPALITWGFALLAGAPMGFVRRFPLTVCALLAAVLVVCDQVGAYTANTAQILLSVAAGVAAHRGDRRRAAAAAVLTAAATAVNVADPGIALTTASWYVPAVAGVIPVAVGRYLRHPIEPMALVERRPGLDLLLAGGGVAFMVLDTWTKWHDGPLPVWGAGWFTICCGLTAGLARTLPGTAFAVQALLVLMADRTAGFAVGPMQGLFLVTLGVFAMRASWSWTGVAYVTASIVTALSFVGDELSRITPPRVIALLAMVAAPVAIGRYVGIRRATTELRLAMAEEARLLTAERARADLLAERERIARDVHDIVAHHVGAMVLRAGAAQYAAPSGPVAEALADIRATGHQVLEDLRGLLSVVRDPDLGHPPLLDPEDVVREAVERMNAAGLRAELRLDPEVGRLPLVSRASAARIVQEGLTNVLKHAGPGTSVAVELAVTGDGLTVDVVNGAPPDSRDGALTASSDGAPPRPPAHPDAPEPREIPEATESGARGLRDALPGAGQGVAGMRERARALGGRLSAGPDGAGGWRLAVTLPADPADPAALEGRTGRPGWTGWNRVCHEERTVPEEAT
ncbi:sensor histidine kinase [Streptosporangium sandarakinum]|uniref:sensor histidine kinase n=1 Tax=Streptosporangium sandarakinum TaxID=1260955 RepID=UPI00371DB8E5